MTHRAEHHNLASTESSKMSNDAGQDCKRLLSARANNEVSHVPRPPPRRETQRTVMTPTLLEGTSSPGRRSSTIHKLGSSQFRPSEAGARTAVFARSVPKTLHQTVGGRRPKAGDPRWTWWGTVWSGPLLLDLPVGGWSCGTSQPVSDCRPSHKLFRLQPPPARTPSKRGNIAPSPWRGATLQSRPLPRSGCT